MMPYLVGAVGFLNPDAEFLHMPIDPLTVFEFFLKRHSKLETNTNTTTRTVKSKSVNIKYIEF